MDYSRLSDGLFNQDWVMDYSRLSNGLFNQDLIRTKDLSHGWVKIES